VTKQNQGLTIGELARRAGISTDTVRHYESKGVIPSPARQLNGYRVYPVEALSRIMIIRRALAIGFTLDELSEVMRVRDSGGRPCHRVRDLAAAKLRGIDEQLRELKALRKHLCATLKKWDADLAKTPAHQRAYLLEKLRPTQSKTSTAFRRPFRTNHNTTKER